jgi:hypothetical protein
MRRWAKLPTATADKIHNRVSWTTVGICLHPCRRTAIRKVFDAAKRTTLLTSAMDHLTIDPIVIDPNL